MDKINNLMRIKCILAVVILFLSNTITSTATTYLNENKIDSLQNSLNSKGIDAISKVETHIELSESYLKYDLNKSLDFIQNAIKLNQSLKNTELSYKLHFQAGKVYFYIGLFDQVAYHWLKSLDISKDLADEKKIAKVYFNLSALYIAIKEYDKAEKYLEASYTYFRNYKDTENYYSNILSIYNNKAIIFQNTYRVIEAENYFKSAIVYAKDKNLRDGLLTSLNSYASFLFNENRFESAKKILLELQQLNKEEFNKQIEATLLIKLARIEKELNNQELAIKILYEGYSIANETNSISLKREYTNDIYLVQMDSGNSKEALEFKILNDSLTKAENREITSRNLERSEYQIKFSEFEKEMANESKQTKSKNRITKAILFIVLIFVSIFLYKKIIKIRSLKQQKNTLEVEKQKLAVNYSQINEKLEIKDRLLTYNSIKQIRQKEILKNTIDQLKESPILTSDTKNKIKAINYELDKKVLWDDFDLRFNQINKDFYENLQNQFSDLTINEKRLCAFLRMEMSTKEIVNITGQSLRAVEIARTRLRKKLGLNKKNIRLTKFLKDL